MLQHTSSPEKSSRSGAASTRRSSALRRSVLQTTTADANADADDLESLPGPTPTQPRLRTRTPQLSSSASRRAPVVTARSPAGGARGGTVTEEVGESPADAPGSGQRRVVAMHSSEAAAASSVLLQRAIGMQEEAAVDVTQLGQTSSPLTRKSMTSAAGASRTGGRGSATRRRSARVEDATVVGDVDELSPENTRPRTRLSNGNDPDEIDELSPENMRRSARLSAGSVPGQVDELSPDRPGEAGQAKLVGSSKKGRTVSEPLESSQTKPNKRPRRGGATKQPVPRKQIEPVAEDEAEEAQEIDAREAARRLGRKRPRRSIPEPSPEPEPPAIDDEPAPKKRRRKAPESPAVQRHPKIQKEARKPKGKPGKAVKRKNEAVDELEGDSVGGTVPVTVQRFTRKVRYDADDTGADILSSDIPFANRAGVNAIDVLSQLCEVLAESFLANLEERVRSAGDNAAKREFRTMMRALEAFREELRTRLLQQVGTLSRRTTGRVISATQKY